MKNGDYDALIKEIVMAREKNIGQELYNEIKSEFEDAGWDVSRKIVHELLDLDRIPSNLYGKIKNFRKQIEAAKQKTAERRDHWAPEEGCASHKEFCAIMRYCAAITCRIQSEKGHFDYKRENRDFLQGYEAAMHHDKINPGALETWIGIQAERLEEPLPQTGGLS